jgi:branched-chain amino acid transport system substrate-binding protein
MSTLCRRTSRAWRSTLVAAMVLGLGAVPLVLGTPSASAAQASGEPIVLGNVGTYSAPAQGGAGSEVSVGKAAIQAWAKWVNAHGGINGHPVKLIVRDNKNDQALAVSQVKELVENEHVAAFVSNQDGSLNGGYADYLEEKGIPVIGGSVFTIEPWVSNPMFFPEGLTSIPTITSIIDTVKAQGFKNMGSLACAEAAQCAAANKLIESLAGDQDLPYVYGGLVASDAPDYTAPCLAAKQADAEILALLIATADEGIKIADDCARQGYTPGWFLPGEAISAGYLESKSFNGTYDNVGVRPWFSKAPAMKDFHAAMKKYAKDVDLNDADLPMNSVDAWASGLLVQKAVELSGAKGMPTTADILAGLAKIENETLGGFSAGLTFTDTTNKNQYCYFTILIKNQKFTLANGGKTTYGKPLT